MKYTLCCSGSKGNSLLLEDKECVLVIDCGSTKRHLELSYRKVGVEVEQVDACLITHHHMDHISQIKMFKHTHVYSTCDLEEMDNFHPIEPYDEFFVKHLHITALPLSHDAKSTVGYVIENSIEKLVYITDTGYLNESHLDKLYGADYIIIESNHDIKMLMESNRPHFIKQRILSDNGHLCNENCAEVLGKIVTQNTKQIFLAHISAEANTPQRALKVNTEALMNIKENLNPELVLIAASQYELLQGGNESEKISHSMHCCSLGLE